MYDITDQTIFHIMEWPNGDKTWWLNGKWHRPDGPAMEYANGDKEWYLNGIKYSFEKYVKKANWSDEQIVMYKLTHG